METIRGLEKTGSILRFETIEDYVDFVEDSIQIKWQRIDDFTEAQGFENYFVQNPIIDEEDSLAMDEMFGKLLNADAVVIIGDYAVKIDLPNEAAYVSPYNNLSTHYADLISGNTGNKNVKKFSTDDDVIDYLLTGVDFDKCGGSASFDRWTEHLSISPYSPVNTFRFQVKYFKGAIYYSVRVKGRMYGTPLPVTLPNIQFEIQSPDMRMHPRPCNSNGWVIHHPGIRNFSNWGTWSGAGTNIYRTWLGYERTRGLNKYRIWIRGYVNGTLAHSNWIGRTINI